MELERIFAFYSDNDSMEVLTQLLSTAANQGRVEWIGTSPGSRGEIAAANEIQLVASSGIPGDHRFRAKNESKRQVTLIQHEHFPVVAALMGRDAAEIAPELLRRNIVVSGINLAALRFQTFQIGTAILRGTGTCPPCSRMEENLGAGGYAAMLAHGGITAVVESGGKVAVGDGVTALEVNPSLATQGGDNS